MMKNEGCLPKTVEYKFEGMGCDQTVAIIKMFLVLTLLIITLANCEARDNKLPSDLKSTFEEINEKYNTHMKWDTDLADKAAEAALTPYYEGAYLKIRGQKEFSKKDESTLADRLHLVLKNPFQRMGNRVRHLPEGTTYGCSGIYDTEGRSDLMYVACLYNKP
nr:15 kDa excretory/secretory protein [Haemonchus contortus]